MDNDSWSFFLLLGAMGDDDGVGLLRNGVGDDDNASCVFCFLRDGVGDNDGTCS